MNLPVPFNSALVGLTVPSLPAPESAPGFRRKSSSCSGVTSLASRQVNVDVRKHQVTLDLRDAALAGALVKLITVPLERVLIPLYSCSDAARQGVCSIASKVCRVEGLQGFFKGGTLDLLRGGAARGITVGLVDSCKLAFGVSDLVAGAMAGASQTLLLYPFEVVQTVRRRQIGTKAGSAFGEMSTSKTLWLMAQKGGIRGLYPALCPSLAGFSAFYALQFGARRPIQEATGSPFVAGFLGSVIACALCNWNNVIRLTMQHRAVEGGWPQRGWAETFAEEYRAGGIGRFYVGFGVKMVQTGASMGLILAVYEWLRSKRLHDQCGHIARCDTPCG